MQTHVVTEKQARQITGGRKPLVPVEYEAACKALAECSSLDEAKYWDNKADALAAWARIYHNDEVGTQARKLKLHAYRRMGQIAEELRPTKGIGVASRLPVGRGTPGNPKGARSLLIEHGLSRRKANNAMNLARAPQDKFDDVVRRARGVAVAADQFRDLGARAHASCSAHRWLCVDGDGARLTTLRSKLRSRSARTVAKEYTERDALTARAVVVEIQEWLDEFEQYLPK